MLVRYEERVLVVVRCTCGSERTDNEVCQSWSALYCTRSSSSFIIRIPSDYETQAWTNENAGPNSVFSWCSIRSSGLQNRGVSERTMTDPEYITHHMFKHDLIVRRVRKAAL